MVPTPRQPLEARATRIRPPEWPVLRRRRWIGTTLLWLAATCLPVRRSVAQLAEPIWLDANGRPNASARDALRLLSDAAADGLARSDYRAAELVERGAALNAAPGAADASGAAFERALDRAVQRYLRDLHLGRVDPRSVGFRVTRRRAALPDFAALLQTAAAARRLPQLAAELRPRLAQYGKLREALVRYRALATDRAIVPISARLPVRPDDEFAGAAALHGLLVALGDLHADAPLPTDRYDATLVDGVRRFQQRHGLDVDGVIGRATLAELNVPIAQRVQQLELALERLRWLPDLGTRPFVGINIPMFRLWARDPGAPTAAPIDMGVVVGRALDTRTPVLIDEMRYLIFRPYWNVPRSILTHELLPALARDPGYLQRNDMEIVRGAGDDAPAVDATLENLGLLRQGMLRVRQRPGPKNSLGLVKFIFPNDEDVYLHGTPATGLFGRSRRDFSHGCVRLEDPVALAQWVLRDQPHWTRERIEAAMADTATLRVNLSQPIPVILFYMTAMVALEDGRLHFAPDIYGHDAALTRALAARSVD